MHNLEVILKTWLPAVRPAQWKIQEEQHEDSLNLDKHCVVHKFVCARARAWELLIQQQLPLIKSSSQGHYNCVVSYWLLHKKRFVGSCLHCENIITQCSAG